MNKGIIVLIAILIGCSQPKKESKAEDEKLNVVATTGMLYDAVVNIAGDQVNADFIMGPGVDPHLYKATQGDLRKINEADLVIYNGLALEGKMGEILEKLGRRKPVIAAASKIPEDRLLGAIGYQNAFDPHIWFDLNLWKMAVKNVEKSLSQNDPKNATVYSTNAELYVQKLDSIHLWAVKEIQEIPESQRILITAHDAFQYFGKAYGMRVEGLQGISTVADIGLRDIARIIDVIIENDIKAIFVETSVSEKTINAVIEGCQEKGQDVVIGGALFSDAMGEIGTPTGNLIGMFRSNVITITQSLK